MIIEWVLGGIVLMYCLMILYLWLGWENIEVFEDDEYLPSVVVIVPVRNEAEGIHLLVNDMQKQTYKGSWQAIIVDDDSNDATVQIVTNLISDDKRFLLLELKGNKGKKSALARGIAESSAEVILTTDGDCRMGPEWMEAMVSAFQKNIQMVSGPVGFGNKRGLFHQMQVIEFASLIGSGAAMIGWEKPIMANGANLAFKRSAYDLVGGYEGNGAIASGDDVFLLHQINRKFVNSIAFAKNPKAIVETASLKSLRSFWQQRKRWASKWKAYSDTLTKGIAVLVFLMSFSFALMPILAISKTIGVFVWLNLLVAKSFFDFFFLRQIVRFSGSRIRFIAFLFLQLIHPFYVIATALFSLGKTYTWKGRTVQ